MICRLLGLLLLSLMCTACNVIGMVAVVAAPPRKIAPVYAPPKEPLLILVENFNSPSSGYLEAEQLSQLIATEFKDHQVAPTIDTAALWELRDANPSYRSMSIAQIGQRVGAKQVLYVRLVPSSREMAGGSDMFKARLEVRLKVVDVATGNSRWPAELADGYPMSVDTPFQSQGSISPDATLRANMCHDLAVHIGELFYERTVID